MVFVLVGMTLIVFLLVDFLLRREDRELREAGNKKKEPIFLNPEKLLKPIKQVDNRYYHPSHSWVQTNGDGYAYIGFDDFISRIFSKEVRISDLPLVGSHVPQGADIWYVGSDSHQIRQLSPVGGTVVEINPACAANVPLQSSDVEKSWILKFRTDNLASDAHNLMENNLASLMNSALTDELVKFSQDARYLNDGGSIDTEYLENLPDDEWQKILRKFFPFSTGSEPKKEEV